MSSERLSLTRDEIEERAAQVRKDWSPEERLARLELPPDSILWDEFGLARPKGQGRERRSTQTRDARRERPGSRIARPQRGF